ncbi:MAG: magnesium and cobalt transport protein CorA [Candidatus Diapherotrites archaeon CG10_big_fil_rev_8_21_14_0_10_31_34]|nr:MAG: magnesium and cobalt transport protein CorA [Candidatus Diapherotrites archaeon CG10_big_fil_rev_8_21_14_0_10_31_34]
MPLSKYIKKSSAKPGISPGTLVHVGKKQLENSKIELIDYTEKTFEEKKIDKIEDCFPFKDKSSVSWFNIIGLHDLNLIEKIGSHFEFHPLVLEDIVNTNQRPKLEDFESYLFLVLKMVYFNGGKKKMEIEQISFVVGKTFVFSFQEREGDVFDGVRERIRNAKGKIRKMGTDYLVYALVDAIVDSYFSVLEKIGEEIELLEEKVMENPSKEELNTIYRLKHNLIFLRRSVWPLREVISAMQRGDSKLISKQTLFFLRDVYDHTIQVIDTIETFRDMVAGMLDVYLSSISNKMNEVMKVLTIIATIFIPLTFIAGVYGMNFKYMPELDWEWSYPILWIIMISVAFSMFLFFRKKKWL